MAKRRPAKCTVEFGPDSRGVVEAVLWFKGRSLNIQRLGKNPTDKQRAKAASKLMRGCRELTKGLRR
jgi:hypothetical protein